ncbi:MAG: glycosyltransferase family 4 protein [Alphaproteobacteria bacterium]|nr:glycosyltransferase family 4 protein [Alphaproteobacteria bacterium]
MLRAIDRLRQEDPELRHRPMRVEAPPVLRRAPDLATIPVHRSGRLGGQAWEQLELPRAAGDGLLVNLCNLAPLVSRRSVTLIHDAQVFASPGSYGAAFRAWYRLAQPLLGRRQAKILTVSAFSAEALARFGVAPRARIEVVHNGVDHLRRIPADPALAVRLGLAPGAYAVALANTQSHKNVGLLMRAFADPRLSGVALVLFGGADRAAFEAAGHAVPPNAVFAGRASDAELRGLLEAARCLLFPSTTEGFGLPPLEAMDLGCPAVVAPCGALPEVCGPAATTAPADDPAAWAEAVRARGEPGVRARWSEAGRARAAGFTWEAAARRLLSILDALPPPAEKVPSAG